MIHEKPEKESFGFSIHLKSKHLLVIMTLFCGSTIVATLASGITAATVSGGRRRQLLFLSKRVSLRIGVWLTDLNRAFKDKRDLVDANKELQNTVDTLTEQNNILIQNQSRAVQASGTCISWMRSIPIIRKLRPGSFRKDPGNWYDTFMINKGSKDGIRVDNNVIAGKGLVGIVTEVGSNWATVRSIIDDSSNVSAMTVGTDDTCVVEGDLELIDEGKLRFTQLYDKEDKVTAGERIVTSNISEKYVEGLFIGYVSEISLDSNNLTKTGTLVTPVDFQHLKDVFVITVNKTGFHRGRRTVMRSKFVLLLTTVVCFLIAVDCAASDFYWFDHT